VQTLLAHVLALEPTQEAADALVAPARSVRARPAVRGGQRPARKSESSYAEEIEACIGRIFDEAVSQDAYAHRVTPRPRDERT
jgi:hypothetical protein